MNNKLIIYMVIIVLSINLVFLINKRISNNKSRNILVMYSGGLDSTTSLYKLLKESNHNIYVHHIILKDSTNRWNYELKSTYNILNYLKQIRNFNYTESVIDLKLNSLDKKGGSRHDDLSTVIFIASQIFSIETYKKIDDIVISNLECELDPINKRYINEMIDVHHRKRWTSKKPKLIDPLKCFYSKKCSIDRNNLKKLRALALKTMISEYTPDDINYSLFQEIICTKRRMYKYLPNNLRNKIVYCRNPIKNKNCGKCFNCLLYKNII